MSISGKNRLVKCRCCGETCYRDELNVFTERHGLTEPQYEYFLVCPFCGDTSLEDAEEEDEER